LLARLRHQIELSADPTLVELLGELSAYPTPSRSQSHMPTADRDDSGIVVPFQLVTDSGLLTFFSTTTVFGTPIDITLSELAIEAFFPADAMTGAAVRRFAHGQAESCR
jgi:MmyB-like transcription regulator ligand binding domain